MAAIAHSNPYAIFIRRIGYTGGLEHTLERVHDLYTLYKSSKDVTASSWENLVSDPKCWGLKKSENITDAFYSLGLIQKIPASGDLLVLENLDALAIACAMLDTEEEQQRAKAFMLLWAIVTNDGEIFINLLLAEFEETRIKENLSEMIGKKRDILCEKLPGRDARKRIYRTVNIERQEKNKGSAGRGTSMELHKRVGSLQSSRTLPLMDDNSHTVAFSEDYFRKVPPRRKDWARSLGLWDAEGGLTQKGEEFAGCLRDLGYIDKKNLFIFWPMDYELVRAGFRSDLLDEKNLWDSLVDFGTAYAGLYVRPSSRIDVEKAVNLIERMIGVFQSLHVRKLLLRRELPITVAYPAIVAFSIARREPVINLPLALKTEQEGEQRRIAFRKSRNAGGALSLRKQL